MVKEVLTEKVTSEQRQYRFTGQLIGLQGRRILGRRHRLQGSIISDKFRIDGREQWWRWRDQLGGYCMVQVRGDDGMMAQIRRGGDQKGWDTGYILNTECTGFPDRVDVKYEREKKKLNMTLK